MYYTIKLWLVYDPEKLSDPLKKRYTNFIELQQRLGQLGIQNLPQLPPKKYFMNDKDHDERQKMLEQYLRDIINRKETRNSKAVIEFLAIDKFCPEIIYSVP